MIQSWKEPTVSTASGQLRTVFFAWYVETKRDQENKC